MLGNFQHNPDRIPRVLESTNNLTDYFQAAIDKARQHPREGLIQSFMNAEIDGDRLTDEEIVANCIVTMVGGQETTTNLIGNGLLTLMRNPEQLARLRDDPSLIPSAVEELLRYESPSQHTGRIAREDVQIGGKEIRKGQAVMAIMAAANRDPERFPDPDQLILDRTDNKHLAFGWSSHFCFGAPLARMEGQIAFETMLRRLPNLEACARAADLAKQLGSARTDGSAGNFLLRIRCSLTRQRRPDFQRRAALCWSDISVAEPPGMRRSRPRFRSERNPAPLPSPTANSKCGCTRSWPAPILIYNEPITIHRHGELNVSALERSFAEIVRRHEAWRTTFQWEGDQVVQIVQPAPAQDRDSVRRLARASASRTGSASSRNGGRSSAVRSRARSHVSPSPSPRG